MIDLDSLVADPCFLPYSGWHLGLVDQIEMPAIQQNRNEFLQFAGIISNLPSPRKCLQIGLGYPGASHHVFSHLFDEAWTIEISAENISSYKTRLPNAKNLIHGSSHDPAVKQAAFTVAPFDLLFIDGDHQYEAVRRDFTDYSSLVRSKGVVAFHDAIRHAEQGNHVEVWRFIGGLEDKHMVNVIGTEIGIAYFIKD